MRYPLICKGVSDPSLFLKDAEGKQLPFTFSFKQWLVELILSDKAWKDSTALVDLNLKLQDMVEAGDWDEGKRPALTDADHEILDRLCRSIDPQVLPAFQVLKLKFLRFVSCIGNAPSSLPVEVESIDHKGKIKKTPVATVDAKHIEAFDRFPTIPEPG